MHRERKVMSVPEDDEDAASEHDWDDQALLKESLKSHLMVLLYILYVIIWTLLILIFN